MEYIGYRSNLNLTSMKELKSIQILTNLLRKKQED
jgi:hypothetical protein